MIANRQPENSLSSKNDAFVYSIAPHVCACLCRHSQYAWFVFLLSSLSHNCKYIHASVCVCVCLCSCHCLNCIQINAQMLKHNGNKNWNHWWTITKTVYHTYVHVHRAFRLRYFIFYTAKAAAASIALGKISYHLSISIICRHFVCSAYVN